MKHSTYVLAALVAILAACGATGASAARVSSPLVLGNLKMFASDVTRDLAASAARPKVFNAFKHMPGHDKREQATSPRPHEYVQKHKMPKNFVWSDVKGHNYLTKNLNQHVPQYCGSCWAHGAMSALADRIKIANGPDHKGPDVDLAIQFILNCGTEVAGSCHGGSATGAYQFVKEAGFVPYDTCLQYEACSAESSEGSCAAVTPSGEGASDRYACNPINTCRTCSTFSDMGGFCSALDVFPNATVGEYGEVRGEDAIMAEVFARGPVAAGVDATILDEYQGGIITDTPEYEINHIVSIVGWGETEDGLKYWVVRNSWGHYWGEMGFFRIVRGVKAIGIEDECSWATPATWTHYNVACFEDGSNCVESKKYVDPSVDGVAHGERRLA